MAENPAFGWQPNSMTEGDNRLARDHGHAEHGGTEGGTGEVVGDVARVGDASGCPWWPIVVAAAAWLCWAVFMARIATSSLG